MDILGSGPFTLDEIIDHIRIQSKDESSNSPMFSDEEIQLAVRQAIINARDKYFRTASYELSYTGGTNSYTLPEDIETIIFITRGRNSGIFSNDVNTLSTGLVDEMTQSYRHIYSRESNTLVFTRQYDTGTFTIYYYQNVPIPIGDRTLAEALTANGVTATLTDAAPNLWRLTLPAWFRIDEEIVKATAHTGNTSLTITRGAFGTTAASHTSGSTVSQVLFADHDNFYNFIYTEAGRLLNMWRIQSGVSTDVSANVTSARMFESDKTVHIRLDKQPRKNARVIFSRSRRPRRGSV